MVVKSSLWRLASSNCNLIESLSMKRHSKCLVSHNHSLGIRKAILFISDCRNLKGRLIVAALVESGDFWNGIGAEHEHDMDGDANPVLLFC